MTIAARELELDDVEYGRFCDEAVQQLFRMLENVFHWHAMRLGMRIRRGNFLKKEREKRIIEKIVRQKELDIQFFFPNDE